MSNLTWPSPPLSLPCILWWRKQPLVNRCHPLLYIVIVTPSCVSLALILTFYWWQLLLNRCHSSTIISEILDGDVRRTMHAPLTIFVYSMSTYVITLIRNRTTMLSYLHYPTSPTPCRLTLRGVGLTSHPVTQICRRMDTAIGWAPTHRVGQFLHF